MRVEGGRRLGHSAIVGAAVLWGGMGVAVIRLQAAGFDVLSMTAMRAGIGFVCALLTVGMSGLPTLAVTGRDLAVFALAALSGMIGIPLLYFLAIQNAGVGLAALLFYTKPLFVVALAAIALREPVTVRKAVSVLLGFAGVFLVVPGPELEAGGESHWLGLATGIGAGVSGAVFAICVRYSARRTPPGVANAMNLLLGSAVLWLLEWRRLASGEVTYNWAAWPWILAMGTLFGFVPHALYLRGLRDVEAGEANVIALLEPVTAVIVGLAAFDERLSGYQVAGAVLVLTAALTTMGSRSQAPTTPTAEARACGRSR